MSQKVENPYMPLPQAKDEPYGIYCGRLEEAAIKITALEKPCPEAIKALAFIAMEAPADFDCGSHYSVTPFDRIKKFLRSLSSDLRATFRSESRLIPGSREGRVNYLLSFD